MWQEALNAAAQAVEESRAVKVYHKDNGDPCRATLVFTLDARETTSSSRKTEGHPGKGWPWLLRSYSVAGTGLSAAGAGSLAPRSFDITSSSSSEMSGMVIPGRPLWAVKVEISWRW